MRIQRRLFSREDLRRIIEDTVLLNNEMACRNGVEFTMEEKWIVEDVLERAWPREGGLTDITDERLSVQF